MILISFLLLTEHSACPSSQEHLLQCCRPDFSIGIQVPNSGSANGQVCHNRPSLSSLAADRRQGLTLIAPPNAKRRRTIKKILVEVKTLPFPDHKITLALTNHILCIFSPEPSNLQCQNLLMLHPLV
jgi:hypothetical protein